MIGAQPHVVHFELSTHDLKFSLEQIKFPPIRGRQVPRIDHLFRIAFQVLKDRRLIEWKLLFRRINHLQQDDVMPLMAKML